MKRWAEEGSPVSTPLVWPALRKAARQTILLDNQLRRIADTNAPPAKKLLVMAQSAARHKATRNHMSLCLVFMNFSAQDAKRKRWLQEISGNTWDTLDVTVFRTLSQYYWLMSSILQLKLCWELSRLFPPLHFCLKQQLIKTISGSLLPFLSAVLVQHELKWPQWIICLWVKVMIPCQPEHSTAFEANRSLVQGQLRDHATSL